MSKRLDLTGQRYGKLTVLRPAENVGGRTAWLCRCDCGKETIVVTGSLRNGNTKTCGCGRSTEAKKELASWQKLDLTDQRFGELTVLRPAENVGGRTAWVCRCDCGKELVVQTSSLQTGHTKSCGCQRIALLGLSRAKLTYVDGTCVEEIIKNKKLRRNNTSGVTGVEWMPGRQRWKASICFKGKIRFLGYYCNFEDAVKVRKQAEEDLHGAFLREYACARTHAASSWSYVRAKEDG